VEEFWRYLLYACLAWYAVVTTYVAVRGAADIRTMLGNLRREAERRGTDSAAVDDQSTRR